jgi:hypothetical protein
VPSGEDDPETLQINTIEMEEDDGAYARKWLQIEIDVEEYRARKILAVPRCCQKKGDDGPGKDQRWGEA